MNLITRFAVGTSVAGLLSLLIVIVSGASYPDHLFTYGTVSGLALVFLSIILYIAGWCCDFLRTFKQKNYFGIVILIVAAALFALPFIKCFL